MVFYVEYNHHNLNREMPMCDFVDDCEYWGYSDVQLENKSDRILAVFSKKEDKEAIQAQITGFIY